MSLRLLLDVNLPPGLADALRQTGWEARHWTEIGDSRATDQAIMEYALANHYVVITHDLDFGRLLALAGSQGPSVVQLRTQNLLTEDLHRALTIVMTAHVAVLERGALISVEPERARVRVLPLGA
jgi:predicted nuclease of predicted toxin-antitoxin system